MLSNAIKLSKIQYHAKLFSYYLTGGDHELISIDDLMCGVREDVLKVNKQQTIISRNIESLLKDCRLKIEQEEVDLNQYCDTVKEIKEAQVWNFKT